MIEIKIHPSRQGDAWQWCIDNYGLPEPTGKHWAWNHISTFWFHNPEHATVFTLRWL